MVTKKVLGDEEKTVTTEEADIYNGVLLTAESMRKIHLLGAAKTKYCLSSFGIMLLIRREINLEAKHWRR